jgi:hypothetical protein
MLALVFNQYCMPRIIRPLSIADINISQHPEKMNDRRIQEVRYVDEESSLLELRKMRGHFRSQLLENMPDDTFRVDVDEHPRKYRPEEWVRHYYRFIPGMKRGDIDKIKRDVLDRNPNYKFPLGTWAFQEAMEVVNRGFEDMKPENVLWDDSNIGYCFLDSRGKLQVAHCFIR